MGAKTGESHKQTGKITKIRALDGRLSTNTRLDGRACLKTGIFGTLQTPNLGFQDCIKPGPVLEISNCGNHGWGTKRIWGDLRDVIVFWSPQNFCSIAQVPYMIHQNHFSVAQIPFMVSRKQLFVLSNAISTGCLKKNFLLPLAALAQSSKEEAQSSKVSPTAPMGGGTQLSEEAHLAGSIRAFVANQVNVAISRFLGLKCAPCKILKCAPLNWISLRVKCAPLKQ